MKQVYAFLLGIMFTAGMVRAQVVSPASVVIAEINGQGGNASATYTQDYVVLHNRTASSVDITGWTIQYSAAGNTTGTYSVSTALSGSISADGYFLVVVFTNGSPTSGVSLSAAGFTPDQTVTLTNMNGTGGKVALVSNNTAIVNNSQNPTGLAGSVANSCPNATTIIDFVGYGSTGTNCTESTTASRSNMTAAPSSPNSAIRVGNGSNTGNQDTGNTGNDFVSAAPNPRNSSSAAASFTATASATTSSAQGWRMLGAPTAGLTVANTLIPLNLVQGLSDEYPSGTPNLYTGYDGTGSTTQGSPPPNGFTVPENQSAPLTPGKGFVWYLFASGGPTSGSGDNESFRHDLPTSFSAAGVTVNQDITATFSDRGAVGDGFYLLANPFPVHFDVSNVTVSDGTLSTLFQVYNPATNDYTDITASATDGATDGTGDNVATWQGMFGQATGGSAAKTFTYSWGGAISSGSTTFIGKNTGTLAADEARLQFRLDGLTQNGLATQDGMARLFFSDEATLGWDRHDGSKLYPFSAPYAVIAPVGASFRAGEQEVKAQESLPLALVATQEVPLAFTATTEGSYTLTWPTMEALPASWGLTLTDRTTGTVTDLRSASQYRFTSGASVEETRFVVTITPGATTATETPEAALALGLSAPAPNPAYTAAHAAVSLGQAGHVTARLYDVLGRAVVTLADAEWTAGLHALTVPVEGLPAGVYVLRVEAGGRSASRMLTVMH